MSQELTVVAMAGLALAVAVLFAVLVGVGAGVLARVGGASRASALLRGGVAFGGALTVGVAVLTYVTGVVVR